ncbi:MAG: hypothetical protein M3O22_05880 [Pseudomonadota bacterium]|nr:hypothetical protein [Pseudomonadota bacterium]
MSDNSLIAVCGSLALGLFPGCVSDQGVTDSDRTPPSATASAPAEKQDQSGDIKLQPLTQDARTGIGSLLTNMQIHLDPELKTTTVDLCSGGPSHKVVDLKTEPVVTSEGRRGVSYNYTLQPARELYGLRCEQVATRWTFTDSLYIQCFRKVPNVYIVWTQNVEGPKRNGGYHRSHHVVRLLTSVEEAAKYPDTGDQTTILLRSGTLEPLKPGDQKKVKDFLNGLHANNCRKFYYPAAP